MAIYPRVFMDLQKEMKPWLDHNFPNRETWEPLVGIGEELGELLEADTQEKMEDAVADVFIYLVHYCNDMDIDLQAIYDGIPHYTLPSKLPDYYAAYGKICHGHLKLHQKIRNNEDHRITIRAGILKMLVAFKLNWPNMEELVWKVWKEEVQPRDWQVERAKEK